MKSKSLTLVMTLFLAIAIVVIATGASGCNPFQKKATEKSIEKAIEESSGENVKVDIDNETTTFTTDEGSTVVGSGSLPDNFPEDVPIYPDTTITFSHVGSGDEESSASTTLETKDSQEKVTSWYKEEIAKNGWTIESTDNWGVNADQYTSYTASKNDRELSIGVSVADDLTLVTISVYKYDSSFETDTEI